MTTGSMEMFTGPVEADECYIGGLEKFKHSDKKLRAGRGGVGKQIVMGIVQRGKEKDYSKVRAKVIPNTTKETLHAELKDNVEKGAQIYTDAHRGYRGLFEHL